MAKKKNATRKDGRIAVQVYLGRDENNKRIYKTVYGSTQKEADEKALQVKLAMRKGIDVTAERDTFAEWAERWLAVKCGEVGRSQQTAYVCTLKHLLPEIGHLPITSIKTIDIQRIVSELAQRNPTTGRPSARGTLKYVQFTASQIFRLAIENRVLDYNPANAVKLPKTESRDIRRALTTDEQSWIIGTKHRAQTAAMIMMFAGLRRGELIPLTWSDVDLSKRTINVNKAVERVNGRMIVKPSTKTESGMRTIDLPMVLVDYLRQQPRTSVFVCPAVSGRMHTESSWTRMWESYLCDINFQHGDFSGYMKKPVNKFDPAGVPFVIPRFTPHWLRHTYATMLYFAGVDVMTAKEQLGHASITTTLGIYTHLDNKHKRREMDKLDAFCGNASHMQVNGMNKTQ